MARARVRVIGVLESEATGAHEIVLVAQHDDAIREGESTIAQLQVGQEQIVDFSDVPAVEPPQPR